jgi:fumarylacetoacetase
VGFLAGGEIVDLAAAGLGEELAEPSLDRLLARGRAAWEDALGRVLDLLERGEGPRVPVAHATLHLPFAVADYVDFYSSLEHATNMGRMFRPGGEPLLPNWRRLPVGYHGRAGTVVVSGTDVVRPCGQLLEPGADEPVYAPTRRLDVELELGLVVGTPSRPGGPVPVEAFAEHVFGVVLVNDWSARDIQAFEYEPLGPFLGKSFQTSISAWVTPLALLEQARVEAPRQEPAPLPHLAGGRNWGLDVELELELNGAVVSRGNARTLYWTMPQQLAHATSNGATLRTGDLMASGTISGSEPGSEGSLIELWQGSRFLEDGDEVVLRGSAGAVELGEVRGRVLPARR